MGWVGKWYFAPPHCESLCVLGGRGMASVGPPFLRPCLLYRALPNLADLQKNCLLCVGLK